jgi:hypothetical protein
MERKSGITIPLPWGAAKRPDSIGALYAYIFAVIRSHTSEVRTALVLRWRHA